MSRKDVIRVGDQFRWHGKTYKVISTFPGGKIDLFDKENCRFVMRLCREVKTWERC